MASQSSTAESRSLVSFPSNAVAYVVIVAALVTAAIHLLLAPRVMGFDRMQGALFYLNGLGFLGGVLLFVTRYWRRWLYLVAVGYALATILAFFAMGGPLNQMAIVSKAAEAVVPWVPRTSTSPSDRREPSGGARPGRLEAHVVPSPSAGSNRPPRYATPSSVTR